MPERLFLPHHHVALDSPFFNTCFRLGTLLYISPRCFALCSSTAPRVFPYRIVHCSRLLPSSIQLHNSSWLRSAGQALGLAIR
jgi:hypothetical protein